jgi:hypothetical protein
LDDPYNSNGDGAVGAGRKQSKTEQNRTEQERGEQTDINASEKKIHVRVNLTPVGD